LKVTILIAALTCFIGGVAHAGSQCDTAVKNARVALQAGKYQQADTHFQEVSRYCSKYPPVMQFFWAKSLFQLERYDDAERKLKGFLNKESSGKRATQARKLLGQISEIRKAQAKLKKAGMGSARLQDTARLRARKPGTFGFGVGLPEYNATEGFATGLKLPPHPKDTGAIPPALTGLSASDPFGVTPEFLEALSDAQQNELLKSVETRLAGWEKVVNLGGSQDAAVAGRAKAHITALKTYLAKVAKWEQLSVDRDKEVERRAAELDERFQSDSAQLKKYLGLKDSAFSRSQKSKLQAEFDGVYGWYFAELDRRERPAREARAAKKKAAQREAQKYFKQHFVRISAGTFTMGSPSGFFGGESKREDDETQHEVTLTKDFYLMEHEVTQGEYEALMGKNPSGFSSCGSNCPVEKVSWYDAVAYANALSDKQGLTRCYSGSGDNIRWNKSCNGYRLPTEAEWEYAARAGQSTVYAGSNRASEVAWYDYNSGNTTHRVGQKKGNAWGLYDMTGNVSEWVWDRYFRYSGNATDPTGPSFGSGRVFRGGDWYYSARYGRVANRDAQAPDARSDSMGFRLARTAP